MDQREGSCEPVRRGGRWTGGVFSGYLPSSGNRGFGELFNELIFGSVSGLSSTEMLN